MNTDTHIISKKRSMGQITWVLHRWLGLTAGLIVLALGFSGALLLLEEELKDTVEARYNKVEPSSVDSVLVPLNPVLARLEAENPGLAVSVVYWPENKGHAVQAVLRDAERRRMLLATINPWTGEVLAVRPRIETLHYWALQLHYKLLLGKTGMILTTFASLAMILLGLTGLWLNKRVWVTLAKSPMRLGRGARLAWSDLHKWSGVVSLGWVLLLGVTGLIYMILILPGEFGSHGGHQHGAPRDVRLAWNAVPEISALRSTAKSTLPGHEFSQLVFPGGRSRSFSANMLDREAWWWDKRAVVTLDASSGKVLTAVTGPHRTARDRALSALAALHFGTMGAGWVKWLYLVLGAIAPALLSVTGAVIWWIRQRKRRISGAT